MDARVGAVEVHGDCKLEEGITNRLQTLQVEEVVGVRHGQCLENLARTRSDERRHISNVIVETDAVTSRRFAAGLLLILRRNGCGWLTRMRRDSIAEDAVAFCVLSWT